jgi:hypothetical protein
MQQAVELVDRREEQGERGDREERALQVHGGYLPGAASPTARRRRRLGFGCVRATGG